MENTKDYLVLTAFVSHSRHNGYILLKDEANTQLMLKTVYFERENNSKYVVNLFSTIVSEQLKQSGKNKLKLILIGTVWSKGIVMSFIKNAMLFVENMEHVWIVDDELELPNEKRFDEF